MIGDFAWVQNAIDTLGCKCCGFNAIAKILYKILIVSAKNYYYCTSVVQSSTKMFIIKSGNFFQISSNEHGNFRSVGQKF